MEAVSLVPKRHRWAPYLPRKQRSCLLAAQHGRLLVTHERGRLAAGQRRPLCPDLRSGKAFLSRLHPAHLLTPGRWSGLVETEKRQTMDELPEPNDRVRVPFGGGMAEATVLGVSTLGRWGPGGYPCRRFR